MAYSVTKMQHVENLTNDRLIELSVMDGTDPKNYRGIVDPELFQGLNKLHAIQKEGLWHLQYDKGAVPGPLRQRFTNLNILMKNITTYYNKRNVAVKEVR